MPRASYLLDYFYPRLVQKHYLHDFIRSLSLLYNIISRKRSNLSKFNKIKTN